MSCRVGLQNWDGCSSSAFPNAAVILPSGTDSFLWKFCFVICVTDCLLCVFRQDGAAVIPWGLDPKVAEIYMQVQPNLFKCKSMITVNTCEWVLSWVTLSIRIQARWASCIFSRLPLYSKVLLWSNSTHFAPICLHFCGVTENECFYFVVCLKMNAWIAFSGKM